MMVLPEVTRPEDLAKQLGWSERRIRATAKALGACRILGNRMVLTQRDVEAILEATKPCPLNSTNAAVFGTTGAQLPGGDYAALVKQRQKTPLRRSPPKSKAESLNVVSMARRRS